MISFIILSRTAFSRAQHAALALFTRLKCSRDETLELCPHVAVAIAETKGHIIQLGELKSRGAGALLLPNQARLCDNLQLRDENLRAPPQIKPLE